MPLSLQQFIANGTFIPVGTPGQVRRLIPQISLPLSSGGTPTNSVSAEFQRVQNLAISHVDRPVSGGVISSPTGAFVTWSFVDFGFSLNFQQSSRYFRPHQDTPASLAYDLRIMREANSDASINSSHAIETEFPFFPDAVIFEYFRNLIPSEEPIYLTNTTATARVDIPAGILEAGKSYTAIIRHHFWAFADIFPNVFTTQYATATFRVNAPPTILNLRVNGKKNPILKSDESVSFGFTISDIDGPSTFYRIGVAPESGTVIAPSLFDSGPIKNDQTASEAIEIEFPYNGNPLAPGGTYYWRVAADDGVADAVSTDGTDNFRINARPVITSLKINDIEALFGASPTVDSQNIQISWTFSDDDDGDAQAGYGLVLMDGSDDILNVGQVLSAATSVVIPSVPSGKLISVKLRVRDTTEFGPEFTATFSSNAKPSADDLTVNGDTNPGDVSGTPVFEWRFNDTNGDNQVYFRLQAATDEAFASLVWDTGTITSDALSVTYGSTISPAVAPAALLHGILYYWRVQVSDALSSSDFSTGFFSINTAPGNPTLLAPTSGAYSDDINVTWLPAAPLDADGDTVTYRLEITNVRNVNQGWTFLSGPIASTETSFLLDISRIPSGDNYGVRIIASDGFSESDPSIGGTSPRFSIANHPPTSPTFVSPKEGEIVVGVLGTTWSEANPVDVDGDSVFYVLEIATNASAVSPVWEVLGSFRQGTTKANFDATRFEDGDDFMLRIRATDSKGDSGQFVLSGTFVISNAVIVTDFERLHGTLYISTRDGRVFKASESIWQVEEEWKAQGDVPFEVFSRGSPKTSVANGRLIISPSPGSTYLLRHSDEKP